MAEFKVIRPHQGDRFYGAGDVRVANAADVSHLVTLGVLVSDEAAAQAKAEAEAAAQAKAEAAAPQNKAVQPPANK